MRWDLGYSKLSLIANLYLIESPDSQSRGVPETWSRKRYGGVKNGISPIALSTILSNWPAWVFLGSHNTIEKLH